MIHRQLEKLHSEHLASEKGRRPPHSSYENVPLAILSIFALGTQLNLYAIPIAGTLTFKIKECSPRHHLTGGHH